MNPLLDRAISEVSRLPDDVQEAIAASMLEQVEAEKGWAERFAKSPGVLAGLAAKARDRIARSEVRPLAAPARR
ncbi:hypothetical protein HHL28_10450 [Aerophototrophica crusticola]|uniref:Uncharacterized protein n=1 Tax=Aerophototrophica crusticola TaxID=1709002 RepID=A0A858R8X6_9PROT|nr:hypothetical protein HHL28_10450 [Rhodospirillaceae bacterium B3]